MDVDTVASTSAGPARVQATSRTALLQRIRFVDYTPSAITALALTPSTYDPHTHYPYLKGNGSAGDKREILAVGRQNGQIEIHTWIGGGSAALSRKEKAAKKDGKKVSKEAHNKQGWVLERTLAAPHPSRVEHLLFTHQTVLSENDLDLLDEEEGEQTREIQKLQRARPRLFSAGGGADLWEWEWGDGSGLGYVKRTLSSQGGAIWSLAANPTHTTLALGCDDGAVRLVSLADGALEHIRRFDAVQTRLLSIAWGPMTQVQKSSSNAAKKGKGKAAENGDVSMEDESKETDEDEAPRWEDSFLVTGCADSTVRKWDVRSGRCLYRMTTDKIRGEQTLVWCISVLNDRTIVSGDSMGLVKFWDGKMGTQLQSIQAHKADVLCLTVGPEGKSVYSSGVDQKVTQLLFASVSTGGANASKKGRSRWILSAARRLHSHDVRAITASPAYPVFAKGSRGQNPLRASQAAQVPLVISGGLDMGLVLTPSSVAPTLNNGSQGKPAKLLSPVSDTSNTNFSETYPRKASYVPQRNAGLVSFAKEARLLVCRKERQVDIWLLFPATRPSEVKLGEEEEEPKWEKVLEMELKVQTNTVASAISPDGRWLAVSDLYDTKVFKLRMGSDGPLKARRSAAVDAALAAQPQLSGDLGACQLHFTQDSTRLVIATALGSRIAIVGLPETREDEAVVERVFSQHRHSDKDSYGQQTRTLAGKKKGKQVNGGEKLVNGNGRAESATSSGRSDDESSEEDADDAQDEESTDTPVAVSTIGCLASSIDGQWLVSSDLAGHMHVFNLDALQHHCRLPSLALPPVALAFSPLSPALLIAGLADNSIQLLDVERRQIPHWAKALSAQPSGALKSLREPLAGMTFDPLATVQDTLLLYGANWLCKMKLPAPRALLAAGAASLLAEPSKRKRRSSGTQAEGDIEDEARSSEEDVEVDETDVTKGTGGATEVTHKYQPLLLVDFAADGELVVVERPYFNMLGGMTPAFNEKRYGQ